MSEHHASTPPRWRWLRQHLLWIDGLGAVGVGISVIALAEWLSGWYGLPVGLLRGMGVVSLVYACGSLPLAARRRRPMGLVKLLAGANVAWGVVCFVLAGWFAGTATALGVAVLVFEGLYVGGLGVLEWRWRAWLCGAGGAHEKARPRGAAGPGTGALG